MSVTVYCIVSLVIGVIIGIVIGNFYPFRISSTPAFLEAIHKSRKNATDDYKLAHLNDEWDCTLLSLFDSKCKVELMKGNNTIRINFEKGLKIGEKAVFTDVVETSNVWTFSIMSMSKKQ